MLLSNDTGSALLLPLQPRSPSIVSLVRAVETVALGQMAGIVALGQAAEVIPGVEWEAQRTMAPKCHPSPLLAAVSSPWTDRCWQGPPPMPMGSSCSG